ncbi:MAG TPA: phosphoglucomutase/phosphomannomutase family protein [Candidatus Acidoferrales bacterium]|nr:phosphoglucomutase/phosphomannomutase family protein [Candidatus Acidoferrales bacterium]
MATDIKFGTDGWRGVIADDYTFANVRRVARAIAHYVHKHEDPSRGLLVAYDTRFGSRRFAEITSEELAASGIRVQLAQEITPTPALSYMVKKQQTAGGVMITSSHNPWSWNGVKFKATYGGSATPAIIQKIESYIDAPAINKAGGAVAESDFRTPYIAALKEFVDISVIAKSGMKLLIDVMYGAGRGVLKGIFTEAGIPHVEIRSELNPLFPGINPEPILPHVNAALEAVVEHKCQGAFITDGDADRIGAGTEKGEYVTSHMCYAVLLQWLMRHRAQWTGVITRAFNTTQMLDRIAKAYNRELVEHGIGFKYVADIVLSGREVLIGGEESGGIGIPRFLPERDGILNSLLLASAMAEEGKSLGELVEGLQQTYGRHSYGRRDLTLTEEIKQSALKRAAAGPKNIGRYKVTHNGNLDGYKFFLDTPNSNGRDAEAWVLVRGSGTEPLLRVYCEAATPELVNEILDAALEFVHAK